MAVLPSFISPARTESAAPIVDQGIEIKITTLDSQSPAPHEQWRPKEIPQLLQASPYPEADHLLDLDTLDAPRGLLALALAKMHAVSTEYAYLEYSDAFSWPSVMTELTRLSALTNFSWSTQKEWSFYVIVFRSQRKEGADSELVGALDSASHVEAVQSGGLLKYWFGDPDHQRRNLATCLWRNRDDAVKGGSGPGHANAWREARNLYDWFRVERLKLLIEATEDGLDYKFEKWEV